MAEKEYRTLKQMQDALRDYEIAVARLKSDTRTTSDFLFINAIIVFLNHLTGSPEILVRLRQIRDKQKE